jgi:hypothetical protein
MSKTVESAGVHLPIEEMQLAFLIHKLRNEFGYMESSKTNIPKDNNNEIMPLYTYPCYEWINSIDWSGADVFEYGSGYSSYFWKRKEVNLYGVDDNDEWITHENVILEKNLEKYPNIINKINKKFDVIIIDGVVRYDCVSFAVNKIKSSGMIILDNSDWHKSTKELLDKENFIPIHFHGFKPIHVDSETTSCYLGKDFNRKAKSIIPMGGTFRKQHNTDKPFKKSIGEKIS